MITACGGDDTGGSGGVTGPPVPAPPPTLNVTLSAPSASVTVPEGGSATFGFNATYSGSSSDPVVADVAFTNRRFRLDGAPVVTGSSVNVAFRTVPFPAGGASSTDVTFRLCRTSACTVVYPGSTRTFTVNLDVQLGDWATFQRDNAHTGHVAVRYDSASFARAWDWQGPVAGRIRPPAATRGRVIVTAGRNGGSPFTGTARALALNAADGATAWTYDLGEQFHISGAALSKNFVHVTSMVTSSSENAQWVLDTGTGRFVNQMPFASQWSDFNQPVADGDQVYLAAGYFGSVVYSFDAAAGTKNWETTRTGGAIWGGQSPAVDKNHVFYYSGVALDMLDRRTGAIIRSIADPYYQTSLYDYDAGPVLDGQGNVFLFSSGRNFTGRSFILAMSIADGAVRWKSAAEYTTAFAYANGTIYAARNDAHVLSAIDAATGRVRWSTPLPGSDVITGNVIATEGHVFVSSEANTWAIDLDDPAHAVVWTAPTGGRLAISPDNLLLTTGQNRLTAYRLF